MEPMSNAHHETRHEKRQRAKLVMGRNRIYDNPCSQTEEAPFCAHEQKEWREQKVVKDCSSSKALCVREWKRRKVRYRWSYSKCIAQKKIGSEEELTHRANDN